MHVLSCFNSCLCLQPCKALMCDCVHACICKNFYILLVDLNPSLCSVLVNLPVFWAASISSSIMDVNVIPTPLLNCCICDNVPETPAQKLVQATSIGYPALLAYAEAIGNAAIVERMKEDERCSGQQGG